MLQILGRASSSNVAKVVWACEELNSRIAARTSAASLVRFLEKVQKLIDHPLDVTLAQPIA